MGEVSQWPPTHWSGQDQQQQDGQARHGIVVRNTFIDVRQPLETGDRADGSSSPHRRNLSAPPSPARRGRHSEWDKEEEEEAIPHVENDPGVIPNYQWGMEQNFFLFGDDTSGWPAQPQGSDWPDQYIEDDPVAFKFWHEPPEIGASGSSPPGLLLSSPGDKGKGGGRRGLPQVSLGYEGVQQSAPAFDAHLRSDDRDWHGGSEQNFAPGAGMAFSYANGFGMGDQERSGLNLGTGPGHGEQRGGANASSFPFAPGQPGPGQQPGPVGGQRDQGRHDRPGLVLGGLPSSAGGHRGRDRGFGEIGGHPGLGGLGSTLPGFGQDIWNTDASARWVDNSMHQEQHGSAPSAGYSGMPPPPCEPPPPRDASQRTAMFEGDDFGDRKQQRGHLMQPGEGAGRSAAVGAVGMSPPGNFSKGDFAGGFVDGLRQGGGYGQVPGGAGLGIAAGAAAVGPVVSASHDRAGPPMSMGSHPGKGRGRDPLVVGPAAVGSATAAGGFPSSSGMSAGAPGSAKGQGEPVGKMGPSQRRMVNAGKGGQGPWIPEGVDISAAMAMAARPAGRSRREDGKGAGSNNSAAQGTTGPPGSRMPLSGGGPKRTDYIRKYGAVDDEGNNAVPITTMMLKNIPCRKSQEEVMSHMESKGFSSKYDFFYLPRDVKFRANLGYAFINFVTPEDAAAFQADMNGYRFANSGSSKACAVVPAHVQGLMNNLAAFKRTEVMRSSRKPYFSGPVVI